MMRELNLLGKRLSRPGKMRNVEALAIFKKILLYSHAALLRDQQEPVFYM